MGEAAAPRLALKGTGKPTQNGVLDYGLRKYPGPFRTRWRDFWSFRARRRGVWVPPLGEWAAALLGVGVVVIVMWVCIEKQRDEDDPARVARRALAARGGPAMMPINPNAPPQVFQQRISRGLLDATNLSKDAPLDEAIRTAEEVLRRLRSEELIATFDLDDFAVTAVAGPRFRAAPDDQKHTILLSLRSWGQAKAARIRVVRILDAAGGRVIASSYPGD